MRRGVRRGLLLLATVTIMAGTAAAQNPGQPTRPAPVPPGAIVQPLGPDAGAALRGYLTTLADNPRSLDALLGAGREALRMGDAEASLGFYARADEVSPRNARVKVGMASAFVQLGQPQAALRLFEEAASLGAPAAEFAADRGLAFDMAGDPARAQQEYVLAMRLRDEPELRRRMALSLAITGQRDAALRLIDAQLRRHDRAAWRTQAFVLALTGDAAGASRTAHNVLPAGTAQAMTPFLAQLPTLSPSQKAMAVHFGHFPSHGARAAAAPVTADPGALALAMGGAPAAAAPRTRPAAASSRSSRRRAAQGSDSSDPHRLRETGRASRRSTQSASRRAQSTPSPPASPPASATSQPAATGQRPVEVAEVNTRWAGAPYSPAQSPPVAPQPSPQMVPPPSPSPAPIVRSQPQQSLVTTQTQQPALATQSQQAPVAAQPLPGTTQTGGIASPPSQQASPPTAAPPRIAIGTMALPVTIPSASGPVQPSAFPPSSTGSVPGPASPPPVDVSVNSSVEPPVQAPNSPAVGPAVGSTPAPGFALEPRAPVPAPAAQGVGTAFADIAALVNSLPPEERSAPAPPMPAAPPPRRTEPARTAENRPAEPRATARQRPAQPAHPSRHWVQIAGGANRAALPREFNRLRTLAPQQLGRRVAYTTTARATNRLLVGPFASSRAAQEFVNQLAGHDVTAFAWTSAAGQEIERLQTR